MTTDDDLALIRRSLQGDREAFGQLIERYQKVVFNTALRMLNNVDDAADVTQNVFIKAWERLEHYKPKYRFFSWIYKMTVNETLNVLKSGKRMQQIETDLPAAGMLPDDEFEQGEVSQRVELALMVLPPEARAILVLKHFHHLSYREISYIFETPENTIRSRLYEARQRLKDVLLKQGYIH